MRERLLQFMICALALAPLLARAEVLPVLATDAEKTAALAKSLDPLGDTRWRTAVPGALRTKLGTQIHPYCAKVAKAANPALTDADLLASYDRWVTGATGLVADRCWNRYPELRYFLKQWISQMRRTVVVCEPNAAGIAAVNRQVEASVLQLAEEFRAGITFSRRDFWLRNSYESVLGYPVDTAVRQLAAPVTGPAPYSAIETLVHEGFHSTQADVLDANEHYRREIIAFNAENSCQQSALDDTISFITSLCTGMSLTSSSTSAEVALDARVRSCPSTCLQRLEPLGKEMSIGLKQTMAEIERGLTPACDKLAARAACGRENEEKQKQGRVMAESILFSGQRLMNLVRNVLPQSPGMIPAEYLASERKLRDIFLRLEGCRLISRPPYFPGAFVVNGMPPAEARDYRDRLAWLQDALKSMKSRLSTCGVLAPEARAIGDELDAAAERFKAPFGSNDLEQLVLSARETPAEFSSRFSQTVTRNPKVFEEGLGSSALFLGKELTTLRELGAKHLSPSSLSSCD